MGGQHGRIRIRFDINFLGEVLKFLFFLSFSILMTSCGLDDGAQSESLDVETRYGGSPIPEPYTLLTSVPTPRENAASASANGKVYLIGGYASGSYLSVVEEYDPVNDTWTTRAPMPTARSLASAITLNGKIYVFGGQTSGATAVATVEEYDPVGNSWAAKTAMPTARYGLSGSASSAGKGYLIGGKLVSNAFSQAVEEYDPVGNSWVAKTDIPSQRWLTCSATVSDKVYVIGGSGGVATHENLVEEYDVTGNTWLTKSSMPTARFSLSCGAVGSEIYAFSGFDNTLHDSVTPDLNQMYNAVTDVWVARTPLDRFRYKAGLSVLNNKIYLISGTGSTGLLDSIYEYDPAEDF